jgi:polysaccharide export outer membrane protein
MASDDGVQVVDMTPAVVSHANSQPYEPTRLPGAFNQIAGGSQPRSAPRLPDPVFDPELRPAALEVRIPPLASPEPYRIGVGDVLVLATPRSGNTVEELAGLVAAQSQRQGYTVQDDGSIAIPGVGRVVVRGMTLEGAEDTVFQRLIEARVDPSFSLEVSEFNSQRVSIGGAVANPGVVPVTMSPLYLDEVISTVGGLTVADDDYGVIRIYRDGSLYQIPVRELYSDTNLMRVRLIDGDSIFVDTAFDLDLAQAFYEQQIARADYDRQSRVNALAELQAEIAINRAALQESRANFRDRVEFGAIERDYVYIVGEVGSPSRFALPFEGRATLADALLTSGGLRVNSGDPSQIYLFRSGMSSVYVRDVIAYRLDTRNASNFVLATRMELRPGDVVFVAEQPVTRWNRAISQILPSITLADRLTND